MSHKTWSRWRESGETNTEHTAVNMNVGFMFLWNNLALRLHSKVCMKERMRVCVCVIDFPFYVTKDHAVCWKGTKRSKYSLAAFPVTQRCCFTPKQLRNKKKQSSFFVLSVQTVKNNRTNLCIFTQLSREASACSGTESPRWSSLDCSRVDLQDGMTFRNPKNCLKLFQFTYFPRVCEQHWPFSLITVLPQTEEQTQTLSCYYIRVQIANRYEWASEKPHLI